MYAGVRPDVCAGKGVYLQGYIQGNKYKSIIQ